eukprot:1606953-Heterocapsa_arctica.AAC.1
MTTAPRGDGEDFREQGGHQPHRSGNPPWQVKPQAKRCWTCGMEFMAEPQGWYGYVHKNCCSRCTNTGGYDHTRRCRNNNMTSWNWTRWNKDPYRNSKENENHHRHEEQVWDPQSWQQGWQDQEWPEAGQEDQEEEEEVEPEEEEETFDENGRRIQKEKA